MSSKNSINGSPSKPLVEKPAAQQEAPEPAPVLSGYQLAHKASEALNELRQADPMLFVMVIANNYAFMHGNRISWTHNITPREEEA